MIHTSIRFVFLLLISLLLTSSHISKSSKIDFRKIKQLAYSDSTRLVKIFQDIHENPELGFMEFRTSAIVAKELKALGYEVMTGIGKTGVVGILKNGEGPIVMYRADMDCNAVKETTGLPYASTKNAKNDEGIEVPVMHACGHDAHTTWMLGIAKIMVTLKNEWKGTLVMVAQPAEEPGGGANAMAAEMYKKGVPEPDYLLGMHTAPLPVGYYLNSPGYRMAGADQLDVTFHGVGGHGSTPQGAIDPIVMAANAILQYQTIISRNIDPQAAAVLTVGAVQAGTDNNVIPASATLKLNLRWFNETDRKLMLDGINQINTGIAVANNLPKELYPTIKMKQLVIPLKNDTFMVDKINIALKDMAGPGKNILGMPPVMGSEDFQHLVIPAKKQVYDYFLVGIANPTDVANANKAGKMFPYYNHNGDFKVDLTAIPYCTYLGAGALLEMFQK
ncbi:amidohydrolase [Cytophaga aurantiaca]|uniref:amidohydrolase n=1 Tax=Cytophaga aurantiaca TaxID=29530 RepID=UPI0003A231E5|nr:amidohydrolase [Cytophaga aurantiaca]